MANRLQNWIYNKGGWFWFRGWSHKIAKREGNFVWLGVRWLWLTRLLWFITGRKFSYYKWLQARR